MYQIQPFNFTRMNNAEFLAFFVNLQKVIGEISIGSLGISEAQKQQIDDIVQKMTDQVYATLGSEFTAKMQEADERRSAIYKRILTKLQVVNYAESDRDLNKVKDVVKTVFLAKYKMQVGSIAQQERTAIISGFIYDLKERLDEEAQETLGVYSDVVSLEGANNAFIAGYNSRNIERIEAEKGVSLLCRKQLTEVYNIAVLLIQYTANQPAEGEGADKVKDCIAFVNRANVLLDDARTRLNTRLKKEGLPAIEDGEGSGAGNTGGSNGSNGAGGGGSSQGGSNQGATGEESPGTGAGSGNGGSGGNGGNGGQTVDPGSGAIIDGDMAIL